MKKLITGITLATALVSGSAMASKARLIALGQEQNGSFFIDDSRDFFLNVAHIHEHGNQLIFETGSNGANPHLPANGLNVDTDDKPNAEGGFISVSGNTAYGVFLGHEINSVSQRRAISTVAASGTATGYVAQDNVTDFFYGKDNGNMKWAAGLSYSSSQDDTSGTGSEQTTIGGRLGVIKGDMEAYAIFGLNNESDDGAGNEFEGKLGVEVGAMKHVGSRTYFLSVQKTSFEFDTAALDPEFDTMKIKLMLGETKKVNDKVTVFFSGGIVHDSQEIEGGSAAALAAIGKGEDNTELYVPFSVGVEAKVKSWLTLRGSVTHNLWGESEIDDNTNTITNSTDVNAGMGLHFGDLTIDGLIGTGNNGTAGNIATTSNERGVLSTDSLMTRLSMTYKF